MHKKGSILILGGLLFLAAALLLTGYNLWDQNRADKVSRQIRTKLEQVIPERAENSPPPLEKSAAIPEMPVIYIEGNPYIGILKIPVLELCLPVMSSWSYDNLKIAPCRYSGNLYAKDLIIAGHNYSCHFGTLSGLSAGDTVIFKDAAGQEFLFSVVEIDILDSTAVEEMKAGQWDLTLFTCTVGGRSRTTVRCQQVIELSS